ncbi:hypothetical protein AALB39_22970 [Lachnospiraceae bacterium 54-53]
MKRSIPYFTGKSFGIMNITPPESTVIAADAALKSADVLQDSYSLKLYLAISL